MPSRSAGTSVDDRLVLINVPTEEDERVRDLVRCRETFQREIIKSRHYILKFMRRRGFIYRDGKTDDASAPSPKPATPASATSSFRPRGSIESVQRSEPRSAGAKAARIPT